MAKAETKRKKRDKTETVNAAEIARFSALAQQWWDENGPMRPLHKLNPTRLAFLRAQIAAHFSDKKPPTILDIGCGGGLVSENLAKENFAVTGIDASGDLIAVATRHAEKLIKKPTYRQTTVEKLVAEGKKFDVVLALEIIEHTESPECFTALCTALVAKGGLLILSTLNRTTKSFLLGIIGAEYVLRWLPVGTHNWKKFIKPSELAATLKKNGFHAQTVTGIRYNPLGDSFSLSAADVDVNYFMVATGA